MAGKKPLKPLASERTISLFSGRTRVEELQEAARIAAAEDIKEDGKQREPVTEESLERDLRVYVSGEVLSKHGAWRLCKGRNYWYLERLRDSGTSYTGVVISDTDLPVLKDMFIEACNGRI